MPTALARRYGAPPRRAAFSRDGLSGKVSILGHRRSALRLQQPDTPIEHDKVRMAAGGCLERCANRGIEGGERCPNVS